MNDFKSYIVYTIIKSIGYPAIYTDEFSNYHDALTFMQCSRYKNFDEYQKGYFYYFIKGQK